VKPSPIQSENDPWALFAQWWGEVQSHPGIQEKNAMTLATVGTAGDPLARTVLLKEYSRELGFVFYTNYESRKSQHIEANPQVSLLFYWDLMFRQVIIKGEARKTPRPMSEAYWNSRPRESQISGWVSKQSQAIPASVSIDDEWSRVSRKWEGQAVTCPPHWGGFQVEPVEMEFWVGHRHRLHDRVRFSKTATTWTRSPIYP
jgi:pyridoxamine 5'-phosphate oxidase